MSLILTPALWPAYQSIGPAKIASKTGFYDNYISFRELCMVSQDKGYLPGSDLLQAPSQVLIERKRESYFPCAF